MLNELDDGLWVSKINYKINLENELKIAFLDMDYTLIKPKGHSKHPKNENDWVIVYDDLKIYDILYSLKIIVESGYHLVLITNQKGISLGLTTSNIIGKKIYLINKYIKDNIGHQFLSTIVLSKGNKYRKPSKYSIIKFLNENNFKIDINNSFMVGDGAGRKKDYSASDFLLSVNLGIKFFLPEDIFKINNHYIDFIKSNKLYEINYNYEDYCKNNKMKLPSNYRNIYKKYFENTDNNLSINNLIEPNIDLINKNKKIFIIFSGSPASGKTTFYYNYLKSMNFKIVYNTNNPQTFKIFTDIINKNENLVLDDYSLKKNIRKKYLNFAKNNDYYIIGLEFKLNKDLCIFFNDYRDNNSFRKHFTPKVNKGLITNFFNKYESFDLTEVNIICKAKFKPILVNEEEKEFLNMYIE